jgi:enoyl-CoA hydratase
MSYDNLSVEAGGPIARIAVDRPERLNALNRATLDELDRAFAALDADPAVRVIVLRGAGDKAFVAGADITEIREQRPVDARAFSRRGQALMSRIHDLETPVIAAINGYALGGGLELALACHLRIAADNAKLGLPEIKLGIMPGFGGSQRLARLIGPARALELMLSGDPVDAATAHSLGIVNHVVSSDQLDDAVSARAEALAQAAPEAVRGILQAVRQGLDGPLEAGLALETARFAVCCATEDMKEGTGAFLEKRTPTFRGR